MNDASRDRKLSRSLRAMEYAYGTELFGPADAKQRERRIHLAVRRAESLVATHGPSRDEERGGSTSPVEDEERAAAARATRQALEDLKAVDQLVNQIDEAAEKLERLVRRNVLVIDHSKLPKAPSVVGCESCALTEWDDGLKKGGHFEPAMPAKREEVHEEGGKRRVIAGNAEAAKARLCRSCWDFAADEAKRLGDVDAASRPVVAKKHWPPVEYSDLRHRGRKREAGVWLARWLEKYTAALESDAPPQPVGFAVWVKLEIQRQRQTARKSA